MSDSDLLTADQVANRLQLRPRTVRDWAKAGRIPVVRVTPKVVRFVWHDIIAALRQGEQPTEAAHAS